jgi:hypothetical protein
LQQGRLGRITEDGERHTTDADDNVRAEPVAIASDEYERLQPSLRSMGSKIPFSRGQE